jgi:hypothetical protein
MLLGAPNGWRRLLVSLGRLDHQAGRDNATLTEPGLSSEKCLKMLRNPAVPPFAPHRKCDGARALLGG